MLKEDVYGVAILATIALFFGIGVGIMLLLVGSVSEVELIERGLALYCPATGDFAFVGECDQ